MENKKYWIWLSLALGPSSSAPQRLLCAFDNVRAIYEAQSEDYSEIKLTSPQIRKLCDKSLEETEHIINWCEENNVGILTYGDAKYPSRLASLPDAPLVLYYLGNLYDIDASLCLAGVGTRSMTKYGHDTAYAFCYDLARSGAIIVSGMAAGIDTACHRGALDAGGKTIAVLGCRINKVYPASNREIMREIARKGLILTEYHPFCHTKPAYFPQRNRIISGLCQGTIVFEADVGSGSLITARDAVKQGRKLYSLPGKIGDTNALGTNTLIQQGAKLITRAGDILDEYKFLYPTQIKTDRVFDYSPSQKAFDTYISDRRKSKKMKVGAPRPTIKQFEPMDTSALNDLEKRIYNTLDFTKPMSCEQLVFPDIMFGDVMSALTVMEINGYITSKPGNMFIKNHK